MSDRILVATRKGLFTIDRVTTNEWTVSRGDFLGDNVSMLLADHRSSRLYAALDHGHFGVKLQRSTDDGETWQECQTPAYPEPPAGYTEPTNAMSGKSTPWSLKLIWSLETGGPDQPGVIWAGTLPGGLFRSDDHGDSWEFIRSLWDDPKRLEWFGGGYDYPGIHSICVDPRDSQHVSVGVSCGGVWVTRDNGAMWECKADGMRAAYMPPERAYDPHIQDPHRLANCPTAPDCFWVQHHNGVFKTTDDAKTWQELTDIPCSTFGFAVVVHPQDPNTAWLVPGVSDEKRIPVDGKLVVTRTRDGGESFDVLSEGLPDVHAYDLVFRHALDIDNAGDRLVLGSTTGALWISENQGDSWHSVTRHLPPIYCTRFI